MKTRTQKTHAWGLPSPVDPDLFDEIRVSVFLPDTLIGDLLPYVTHSIWIGTMNHLGRFGKGSDMVLQQAIKKIRLGQTDNIIKSIYVRYKDNPIIKWKKETKKVVCIPVPKINGLDI
jgi:hypothetical protein